jgi:hypothetical protein
MEFDGGDGDGELAAAPGNGRKARGKAKAKSGGGGSRPGKGPCVACEEPRHANTKFCKNHKRAYDAMAYQAKKADQNGESPVHRSRSLALNRLKLLQPPCAALLAHLQWT